MSNYYKGNQRKDSFVANHIRLITFLSVVGVFLLVFGSIFVMNARQWFSGDTRPAMTKRDVVLLSSMKLDTGIPVDRVTQYQCKETVGQSHIEVILEVEPDYTVVIEAHPNTKIITAGRLINNKRNETKDIFEDDIEAYFSYLDKLAQAT